MMLVMTPQRTEAESAHTLEAVESAAAAVRAHCRTVPEVALVLGTGLGDLATKIDIEAAVPYADIPGFPQATVETHAGRLLIGRLGGRPIVA